MARWKAKVDDKWYDVEDVVDQGDGKPNLYFLKDTDPVEQDDVEDLQIAASFIERLERRIRQVLAGPRDLRKQLRKRDAKEIKRAVNFEKNRAKKNAKSLNKPKGATPVNPQNPPGEKPPGKKPPAKPGKNAPAENTEPAKEPEKKALQVNAPKKEFVNKIRSLDKPAGFVICFKNKAEEEKRFAQNIKSIIDTPNAMLLYLGNKGSLDRVHVYLFSESKRSDFERQASLAANAPSGFFKLPEEFLSQDAPFDDVDFGALVTNALSSDVTPLQRSLNNIMSEIRRSGGGQSGQIPALRMSSEIPLHYTRFIDVEHRSYEYYTGGNPPDAGTKGTRLVLANEQECENFIAVMNKFKPLNYFFTDLHYVSDVDTDFKIYDPSRITPPRALLLLAKSKFDMDEKVELTEAMQHLIKGKREKDEDGPTGDDVTQQELLEAFVRLKMGVSSTSKPGKFRQMRYYIGNDWIHLNRDSTVAILWGARSRPLSISKKEILGLLPFVKDATLTYLK